jgi:hypothetical protein
MFRKSTMLCLCALTLLMLVASAVLGQQAHLPKQNPFLHYVPTVPTANMPAAVPDKSHQTLPLFTYTVRSSRDGNTYTGTIVGPNPFTRPGGSARVPTQIVPVIITTNSVFAGVDSQGNILTQPGVTVFDPTVPDDSCSSPPFDVPVTMVQQSPIFRPADFNYGGTDVGFVQTTDAFQRASFFQRIARSGDDDISYRVELSPVNTLSAVEINIPADSGVAYPTAAFGGCPTGEEAIIDLAQFEPTIVNTILPALASQGVNPGTFPIFLVHNTVECEGTGCATFSPNTACCVLGFHSSVNGAQTFSPSDYDTSGIFVSPVPDVSIMSHEVAEWMNDPFGHNPVPPWGHIGQQPGCQGNLEVGDPLSGNLAPPIAMPNGFTYHMQELAFFSWFYGAPSIGVNGWFSNNATFLHDAGPVCQ